MESPVSNMTGSMGDYTQETLCYKLYTRDTVSHQNSCVEALGPIVMVFDDGVWKVTRVNEVIRVGPS